MERKKKKVENDTGEENPNHIWSKYEKEKLVEKNKNEKDYKNLTVLT